MTRNMDNMDRVLMIRPTWDRDERLHVLEMVIRDTSPWDVLMELEDELRQRSIAAHQRADYTTGTQYNELANGVTALLDAAQGLT